MLLNVSGTFNVYTAAPPTCPNMFMDTVGVLRSAYQKGAKEGGRMGGEGGGGGGGGGIGMGAKGDSVGIFLLVSFSL